jgi:hypothetical protein
MTHLSVDERLALIEGAGEPRHPHLAACERCACEVADGRAALLDARTADVPDPSPLFWEHFSVRLSRRLDEEPRQTAERNGASWRILVPFAAAVALLVMAVAVQRWPAAVPIRATPDVAAAVPATDQSEADDEGWAVLGSMAGDYDVDTLDDSLGRSLSPGAESVVWHLNEGERAELTRLLQAEMQSVRSGS